jgi:hypothetical protein
MASALKVNAVALLNWLHPRAAELKKHGNSLREICEILFTGEIEQSDEISELAISFYILKFQITEIHGKPLKPMLCKSLAYDKDCLPKVHIHKYEMFAIYFNFRSISIVNFHSMLK